MTQFFIDRAGTLTNIRRTVIGGMLVDATLAKTGVMDYWTDPRTNPDKMVMRRHNPAAVLAAATADVATAAVTHNHPAKFVDIHSYKELNKGHVVGTPTFEDGHIKVTLAINDAELMRAIDLGAAREVSMGYTAHHDGKPGVTESGEAYDESRVKIEWNHIAIVPAGRAGKTVRLMLDSEDIPEQQDNDMALKINGKDVAVESAQAAIDALDGELQGKLALAVAAKDAAEKRVAELEAELVTAKSEDAIDARIKDRDAKAAAQKAADEKLARVKAAFPTVSLEGRDQSFIDGLDAAIVAKPTTDAKGEVVVDRVAEPKLVPAKPPVAKTAAQDSGYERMRAEDRARSLAPVGANPLA
jgi:hypothetical protein